MLTEGICDIKLFFLGHLPGRGNLLESSNFERDISWDNTKAKFDLDSQISRWANQNLEIGVRQNSFSKEKTASKKTCARLQNQDGNDKGHTRHSTH